jgi:hypothetical protein
MGQIKRQAGVGLGDIVSIFLLLSGIPCRFFFAFVVLPVKLSLAVQKNLKEIS